MYVVSDSASTTFPRIRMGCDEQIAFEGELRSASMYVEWRVRDSKRAEHLMA